MFQQLLWITFLLCGSIITHRVDILIGAVIKKPEISFIKVRGHANLQQLPASHTKSWNVWTLQDDGTLDQVPNHVHDGDSGWCDPTTFDSLYLPRDLPIPYCRPAVGIAIANGVARYIMPSIILELHTADRSWRNRGLCSLPRAHSWIDLFAEFTPQIELLSYSCFGSDLESTRNPRFLEDQDGNAAWYDLFQLNENNINQNLVDTTDEIQLPVAPCYNRINEILKHQYNTPLHEGYHFVDIPFSTQRSNAWKKFPRSRLSAFISDFSDTRQLLEVEDRVSSNGESSSILDEEPCAELQLQCSPVAAGKDSPYLPLIYSDLYEEGNILSYIP